MCVPDDTTNRKGLEIIIASQVFRRALLNQLVKLKILDNGVIWREYIS